MIVVADSSPLIILSKIGSLDLLRELYPTVCISDEVYQEIAIAGAGLTGATQVAKSDWIQVKPLGDSDVLAGAQAKYGLGLGELSTILLAKELRAEIALIDDLRARRLAMRDGVAVRCAVKFARLLYRKQHLPDLRSAFIGLLSREVHIDRALLDERLRDLKLPPL